MTEKLGYYKTRCGWGKWHTVHAFLCPHCNKLLKSVINWHGETPRGGFLCPYCNKVVPIQ
jgi:hypothetical protein